MKVRRVLSCKEKYISGRLLSKYGFRPNIVVTGCEPFAEDTWQSIRIGAVEFAVVKPCVRCVLTTTNQETAERGTEPLQTLATYRNIPDKGVIFGQNLLHVSQGMGVGRGMSVSTREDCKRP